MVLDNEATGVMADALSTRLAEIRARLAKATPVNGFCDQHKYLAVICPMCAANMFPDAVFLLDTLEAALRVVETARSIPHHGNTCVAYSSTSPCDGCVEHKLLHDALTAFTQHTEQTAWPTGW